MKYILLSNFYLLGFIIGIALLTYLRFGMLEGFIFGFLWTIPYGWAVFYFVTHWLNN